MVQKFDGMTIDVLKESNNTIECSRLENCESCVSKSDGFDKIDFVTAKTCRMQYKTYVFRRVVSKQTSIVGVSNLIFTPFQNNKTTPTDKSSTTHDIPHTYRGKSHHGGHADWLSLSTYLYFFLLFCQSINQRNGMHATFSTCKLTPLAREQRLAISEHMFENIVSSESSK